MNKPTLILDVDGVLADLETSFMKIYNRDFDDNQKGFTDWNGNNLKCDWNYKMSLFSDYHFFRELTPIKDSIETVKYLNDKFDITIATVCHSRVAAAKLLWLEEHFPFLKNKAIMVSDDFSIKKNFVADVMVDDKPAYGDSFQGMFVCFGDNLYNKDYDGIKCLDWSATKCLLEQYLESLEYMNHLSEEATNID